MGRIAGGALVGAVLGGGLGIPVGALLAIPAAAVAPGGRLVVLGVAMLGAVGGAVASTMLTNGRPGQERSSRGRVEDVVSRLMFKRPSSKGSPPTTPVWRAADPPVPRREHEDEAAEGEGMQQRESYSSHGSPASSPDLNALLGRGSEFEGKLAFEGRVRIDGTFTGEISTNDLLQIGEGAKVQAEISCGTVIVEGEVTGNIKATQAVELRRPAKVHGDITTPSLVIEKGVLFEGRSRMEEMASSNVVPMYAAADES